MALGTTQQFGETVKLIPSQFVHGYEKPYNILLNHVNNEVGIVWDTCDICRRDFIGTEHDDPGQNPIELAISYCGTC